MAHINGSKLVVDLNGVPMACYTSSSIEFVKDIIEASCADQAGDWKNYLPNGEKTGTINVEGLANWDDSFAGNVSDLFDLLDGDALVPWVFADVDATPGSIIFSGNGIISNLAVNGPKNEAASYSFTLQITGQPTKTAVV